MQDVLASVRRSLVFRTPDLEEEGGGFSKAIGACLRRSRVGGFLSKPLALKDSAPPIRWRKGELIGCGAYGRVYMGMNLDSGELLAVKQVLIPTNNASKEKAQAHIRELEEEVKLLKNLSHPNIVRYLGTAREEDTLNILLEFVPGGSISSLLGKFGSFPEPVIRMYTKQLLQGLEYLHKNGIIHRDIKGANILVDNKGCIKLADFGASKQVVELATVSGAKSMKGTPYWMAPEVILQTGHSFSADIWSVGCTVIEMATGKPPWSQQYQEVAALFHIGTTKSHPPIPEHLSLEAKDFLLKCLQKEPNLRSVASDLLQHPFVIGEYKDPHPIFRSSVMEQSSNLLEKSGSHMNSLNLTRRPGTTGSGMDHVLNIGSVRGSTIYPERLSRMGPMWETNASGDLCQLGDKDDFEVDGSVRLDSTIIDDDNFIKSFNPMSEPLDDDWPCKLDPSPEARGMHLEGFEDSVNGCTGSLGAAAAENDENEFCFPSGPVYEDDDEVTESKIRAFLDEKALDLKKLQTPLYEEFYNSLNTAGSPGIGNGYDSNVVISSKLPPKSRLSPSRGTSGTSTALGEGASSASPGSHSRRVSTSGVNNQSVAAVSMPRLNEWMGLLDSKQEPNSPSASFSDRQRIWKQELDLELERQREMKRQAAIGGRTSSPKDRILNHRPRERSGFPSPGK